MSNPNDTTTLDLTQLGTGSWIKLTSDEAATYIMELNASNRPLRNDWCRNLSTMMNDGEFNWQTPDPICISKSDIVTKAKKLLNGQHRLTALVDSDLEEGVFFVMEDVDESVYNTLDQGQKRNASDFYCNILKTRKDETTNYGESSIAHNKHVVRIALCMERMRSASLPTKYRFKPHEQAKLALKSKDVLEAILPLYRVKKNLAYATPVAAAFANAAGRYGLSNVLPLVRAYAMERWRDTPDHTDPLKKLHQLIRDYNAKDKQAKKRVNTQQVMYAYSVAAISSALCKPEDWLERLMLPKKTRNFGENLQREAQIRKNITPRPEPGFE